MGTANQDYFLDAEGNVTTDEEKANTLLIRSGQEIPADMAERYGDALNSKVARQSEEAKAEESAEAEPKAAKASANKKASPSKNKGAK